MHWAARIPWLLLGAMVFLLVFGWLGIARSEELSEGSGSLLRQQMVWSAVAVLAMLAAAVPSYQAIGRSSYTLLAIVLAMLVAVYFFPPVNGARRWIRIAGFGFQPSEFAKVTVVVAVARYLMYRDNFRRPLGLLAPLALTMLPVLLVLREPDLGTALVFLPVLLLMVFAAGARRRDLAMVVLAGLATLPVLWTQMSREQKSRVTALLSQTAPGDQPDGDKYHLHQAKQMLALGGVWGTRLTADTELPADDYVPEGATDSILAVLGERYGLMGVAILMLVYLLLIWQIIVVAEHTREPFARLACAGIAALFAVEVSINTAMIVGLLPITGLSLPLVSYGGSGLVAHGAALGLVVNIAVRRDYELAGEPFRWVD